MHTITTSPFASRRHSRTDRGTIAARFGEASWRRLLAGSVSAATVTLASSGSAFAQSAAEASQEASPEPEGTGGVAEIVVTAQKRAQNLQDVPVAVTAVTGESLEVNRVRSVVDLNGLAPGFNARANAGATGAPTFILRGVFAAGAVAGSDRQISQYLDGVYIGASRATIFDFPDIERIEVLRGPQGTLFGRNATAGAISVVTRNPTGEFGVRQEVSVGNYNQFRTRTTVDLPSFGPFSAYVTYVHDERDGDVRNAGAGTVWDRTAPFHDVGVLRSPRRLGNKNHDAIFAALRLAPSNDLTMTYKFDRSVDHFTSEARAVSVINPASVVGNMLLGIIAAQPAGGGAFGPVILNPGNERPKVVNNGWTVPSFQRNLGHSLTTEFTVSDNLSIKNITAYRKSSLFSGSVITGLGGLEYTAGATAPFATVAGLAAASAVPLGSRFLVQEGNNIGRSNQWSSEFQLNYDSDLVTITAGALWYRGKERVGGLPGMRPSFQFAPFAASGLLPLGNVQDTRVTSKSIAAYAQAEVHLTPELDLVGGARITRDTKKGSLTLGGTYVPATPGSRSEGAIVGATVFPFTYKDTRPNYSIGLNYQANSDLLVYGKHATAFMSGGSVAGVEFAPETVKSFELGLKSDLLDRRLRVNLALYHATYKHAQTAQSGSNVGRRELSTVIADNGTVKAKGVELEVTAAPTDGLTLGGGIGYTDVKAKNPSPALVAAFGGAYKPQGIAKWAGNVYGQYQTAPVVDDAYLLLRLDANFRSKYRSDPNPNVEILRPAFGPYEFVPSAWIVNARVALKDINLGPAGAEVALWARNLTDDKTGTYTVGFADILKTTSYQAARTYGVDFIVKF